MNAINNFFDNLFGTHLIELFAGSESLFKIDVGQVSIWGFILFVCILIFSSFYWLIHIIFERSKK